MGLLTRKPKVGVDEFCRDFYGRYIFNSTIAGVVVASGFFEVLFDSVSEADTSFSSIDRTTFAHEITALRLELFGLAWNHCHNKDKYTLHETIFTKHYLQQNRMFDIYVTMAEYSQIIAASGMEIDNGERTYRAFATFIHKLKMDKYNQWRKIGIDPDCAARVLNRLGADEAWKKGITRQMLTARLANRLGCSTDLSGEALFRLESAIRGFYDGAKEAIKSVSIQTD